MPHNLHITTSSVISYIAVGSMKVCAYSETGLIKETFYCSGV